MNKKAFTSRLRAGQALRQGAVTGFGLALAYGVLFALYAMVRAAFFVLNSTDAALRWGTLVSIEISLLYLSLIFALLFALPAALLGGVTALLLWGVALVTGRRAAAVALLLGVALCGLIWWGLFALLPPAVAVRFSPAYPPTWLFWYLLPGLIYSGAGGIGSWLMARRLYLDYGPPLLRPVTG
jgi:hypothetical protein